jgi:hypothetical protein
VETVVEWQLVPKWHLLELYLSTGLGLPRWFVDIGDAHTGPKLLLVVAKWILLQLNREGWFEFGT